MSVNFRKKFQGKKLKDMLQNATKASTIQYFDKGLEKIREKNDVAYNLLMCKDPANWSYSYFKTYSK